MELTDYALVAISSLVIIVSISVLIKICCKIREIPVPVEHIVTEWR